VVASFTYTYTSITYLFHLSVGDTGKPQPCIKITIDDPASIPLSGEPILLKLIPMTQSITTEPLSIKIELVRDSEFFRLLLHELSYAAALHDTEKERFLGIIDGLENQLTVVVRFICRQAHIT
jgi:E3 ubiquitin-protein ligase BAH